MAIAPYVASGIAPSLSYMRSGPANRRVAGWGDDELKAGDTNLNFASTSTATFLLLNGAGKGDNLNDREGLVTTLRRLDCRFGLYPQDDTTVDTRVTCFIVWDNQPNGVAPTITQILSSSDPFDFVNLDNRARFRILRRWSGVINKRSNVATQTFAAEKQQIMINWHMGWKAGELVTHFNAAGNAGTIADIQNGALYFVSISNQAAGDCPVVAGKIRCRFVG